MATDDVQRLVTGSEATPASFLIPGNGQIRPKTIFASYDGSGAGGDFLPALKIISDGGETVGIFATDSKVVAGASADVTWFPGVTAAATAPTPSAPVMPYAVVDLASYTWPQFASVVDFTGATVTTTDSSVFTNNLAVDPTQPILLPKAGIYLAVGAVGPWKFAYGTAAYVTSLGSAFTGFDINPLPTGLPLSYNPAGGLNYNIGMISGGWVPSDPVTPGALQLEASQFSGSSRNVSAYLAIIRLTADGAGI